VLAWIVAAGLSLPALGMASPAPRPTAPASAHVDHEGAAKQLEGRLLAPCCYLQTLDIHESDSARDLRDEIVARVAAGESADAIEDSFVERYGERVRAVPKGSTARGGITLVLGTLAVLSLFGLVFLVRRWARGGISPEPLPDAPATAPLETTYDARLDQRLDEELRDLEDA
jgi:cytochrome c-type biogenesis protein CcmH